MSDPRASIKSLLVSKIVDANLTRNDGKTLLTWHSLYGPYTARLNRLFHDKGLDLMFVISDAEPASTRLGVSHLGVYPVTPYAIDKYDSNGTQTITATLVLWKAVKELRRIFRENPWGSLRGLIEDRIEVHDFGDVQVWSKPCRIEYKTYSGLSTA